MYTPNFYLLGCCSVLAVLQREFVILEKRPSVLICRRATMVTAILPSMTGSNQTDRFARDIPPAQFAPEGLRHSVAASLDSDLTITPSSYNGRSRDTEFNGNEP